MIKVGITGGIGSGKSTVCVLFARLGAEVYDSDARARELMNGKDIRSKIEELFGKDAFCNDELNRKYIADKVFNDKSLLASLNAIVHPVVAADFEVWARKTESRGDVPYIILESAILFESGFDRFVDKIITVSAPVDVRVRRVVARQGRDGNDEACAEEIRARMANQMIDSDREELSNYVIANSGSLDELEARIEELDKLLRK